MLLLQKSTIRNRPSLGHSIEKLAIAGEQAGFTVEQMIELLRNGLTVETHLLGHIPEVGPLS